MTEFAYNNTKDTSNNHTSFKLKCGYYLQISHEEKVNPYSQSKLVDKLLAELKELMIVCRENFYYPQKLQKQANDKGVKPRSYTPNDKVWLNSKYIKTKQNRKL